MSQHTVLLFLTLCFATLIPIFYADCSLNEESQSSSGKLPDHVNIVLIGATGDLAKKYLWKALYDLYHENFEKGKIHFNIYGAARQSQEKGRDIMSQILLGFVVCHDAKCRDSKKKFIEHVQYHQLKSEKDYKHLAELMEENTRNFYQITDPKRKYETGRIVYLSIPPSAYASTGKLVNKYLRPKVGKQKPWLRVVVEKPFGHDLDSARLLSEKLKKYFAEEELYRIDHYLGKTTVKQILPFRIQNKAIFENIWNARHIDRVEIVMKETLDARGRAEFYNEVGVVRDVMQNHLTELLTLVAMDLPRDSGNIRQILQKKVQVLEQISYLDEDSTLLGQYATFQEDAKREMQQDNFTSNVPTFAATLLKINSPKWKGVRFLLLSGKKLDVKASYVRIVFKKNKFCVSESHTNDCQKYEQIIFHIGGNNVKIGVSIIVTKSLGKPMETSSWKFTETNINANVEIYGQNVTDLYIMKPVEEKDAYGSLLNAVLSGYRHMFVDTVSLMKSWQIWSPLLKAIETKQPILYKGGKQDNPILNFQIMSNRLEFSKIGFNVHKVTLENPKMVQIPATFREQSLVSGTNEEIIESLALALFKEAQRSIDARGMFHIAFSGGSTPVKLLKHLNNHYSTFPWSYTHIWQVDERCVAITDSNSNMQMIQLNLLDYIDIPYWHIHAMPVNLGGDTCDENLKGDLIYERDIINLLQNASFDFILLGVGGDGHTASLFPEQSSLIEEEKLVVFSENPVNVSFKRMTLTFKAINKAHNIAVLISGKNKHEIVDKLSKNDNNKEDIPITGVIPVFGSITWYIDSQALFGN